MRKVRNLVCLVIFAMVSFLNQSMADETEKRLAQLENKVQALESVLAKKLNRCTLEYKNYGYSLDICPKGTFAHTVRQLGGSSVLQVECGYYQIQCSLSDL